MEAIGNPLPYRRDGREAYQEKDITSQNAKVFDMYGGTEYTVRIRFRNELADTVVDQFGKDVGMFPCDDSHFIIQVPVEISPPFFAWIATFGRRVKILSPEPVVEKMRDFLQISMDMYKDEGWCDRIIPLVRRCSKMFNYVLRIFSLVWLIFARGE